MSDRSGKLFVGFIEHFKGGPTVLMIGGAEEFLWLADKIENRWTGALSCLVPRVQVVGPGLYLRYASQGDLSRSGEDFDWYLSDSEVRLFAERLRALASSGLPSHIYLDTQGDNAGVQVIASLDEYDPAKVFNSL